MKVTQTQIASKLGISPIAVSYALRGSRKVSPDTRRRVEAAAQKMGYRLNTGALAMKTGRHHAVAVLLSADAVARSMVPPNALRGMDQALGEAGYHLTLAHLPDAELTDARVPKLVRDYAADALLIAYAERLPEGLIERVDRSGQPAIWLNVKRDHDAVYPDDHAAARDATAYLIDAGHRRIAYFDPSHDPHSTQLHYSVADRVAGYRAAMVAAGLSPVEWTEGPIPGPNCTEAMTANLRRADRPTALVSYGETQSIFFAAAQMGLRVPDDLSLVTFGLAAPSGPGVEVTTWIAPQTSLGRAAAAMILARIGSPTTALASEAVPFRFQAGRSVRPASLV